MAKSKLSFPGELYQPTWKFLRENFTDAELRREYSRLRDIAQKRLGRLGESEFDRSQTYQKNVGKFPKLSTMTTRGKNGVRISKRAEFARKLSELARFVSSPSSSVSGQKAIRNKTIQTLNDRGYKFVNASNYFDFLDFMEEYRMRKLDRIYDSDAVAEVYKSADKRGIDPKVLEDDFEFFMENRAALKKMPLPDDKESLTSDQLKQAVIDYKSNRKKKKK